MKSTNAARTEATKSESPSDQSLREMREQERRCIAENASERIFAIHTDRDAHKEASICELMAYAAGSCEWTPILKLLQSAESLVELLRATDDGAGVDYGATRKSRESTFEMVERQLKIAAEIYLREPGMRTFIELRGENERLKSELAAVKLDGARTAESTAERESGVQKVAAAPASDPWMTDDDVSAVNEFFEMLREDIETMEEFIVSRERDAASERAFNAMSSLRATLAKGRVGLNVAAKRRAVGGVQ